MQLLKLILTQLNLKGRIYEETVTTPNRDIVVQVQTQRVIQYTMKQWRTKQWTVEAVHLAAWTSRGDTRYGGFQLHFTTAQQVAANCFHFFPYFGATDKKKHIRRQRKKNVVAPFFLWRRGRRATYDRQQLPIRKKIPVASLSKHFHLLPSSSSLLAANKLPPISDNSKKKKNDSHSMTSWCSSAQNTSKNIDFGSINRTTRPYIRQIRTEFFINRTINQRRIP